MYLNFWTWIKCLLWVILIGKLISNNKFSFFIDLIFQIFESFLVAEFRFFRPGIIPVVNYVPVPTFILGFNYIKIHFPCEKRQSIWRAVCLFLALLQNYINSACLVPVKYCGSSPSYRKPGCLEAHSSYE